MNETEQLIASITDLRERLVKQVQEAGKEATRLAKSDISSKEAIEANNRLLRLQDLLQRVEQLGDKAVDLLGE